MSRRRHNTCAWRGNMVTPPEIISAGHGLVGPVATPEAPRPAACNPPAESPQYAVELGTDLGTKLCGMHRDRWSLAQRIRPADVSELHF